MLFGVTAPLVGAWLVSKTSDPMAIAWCLIAIGILALISALTMRERRLEPFDK